MGDEGERSSFSRQRCSGIDKEGGQVCHRCVDVATNNWWSLCSCAGCTLGTKRGNVLLVSSSDQTTRLHAEWQRTQEEVHQRDSGGEGGRVGSKLWFEIVQPQIHSYDMDPAFYCISRPILHF